MRTIAGYSPDDPTRYTRCRVVVTCPDSSTVELSPALTRVAVTDALETASSASIELSREKLLWQDPLIDANSPFCPGNPMTIELSDDGATWTRVFDGELASADNPSDEVASRLTLPAAGRCPLWWERQINSAIYDGLSVEGLLKALFVAHGGLADPADFDLPVSGRTITTYQLKQESLAQAAAYLLGPLGLAMWWDPVQRKLSTLPLDSWTSLATLPAMSRGSLQLGWTAPEATRVRVQGGSVPDLHRMEVGPWKTPVAGGWASDGVRITSGSKSDWYDELYWAQSDGSGVHTDGWHAGDWLWIRFMGEGGDEGTGYYGPEGVSFAMSGVSVVAVDPNCSLYGLTVAWVDGEHLGATTGRYITYVKCRIDASGVTPAAGGSETPTMFWQRLVAAGGISLNWEVMGRQVSLVLEQLTAQAWDEALLARFGEIPKDISNPALLVTGTQISAVQAEANRQLARALEDRAPASTERRSIDARIVPGDVITTPHQSQAGSVLLRVHQVQHTWSVPRTSSALSGVAQEAP